jgi:RNA binding exosome subunit
MANACPKQLFHHNMEERRVKGHHGNEIRTISLNLSRKSAQVYPGFLWSNLSSLDHDQVLSSLSELLDEKDILHLRLGKQDCYLGRLRINQEDPVKVEIGFSGLPRLQDEKIQKLKQLLNHFTKELA